MWFVKQYSFPTLKDGVYSIEKVADKLSFRYRRGYKLDEEELDYIDWAERMLHLHYNAERKSA